MDLNKELDKAIKDKIEEAYSDLCDSLKLGRTREEAISKLRRHYQEDQISRALELHQQATESNKKETVIKASRYTETLNWYIPVKSPSSESRWGKLVSVLKHGGWSPENIDSLDQQSNTVVSSLAPPKSNKPTSIKGLVIGNVQSGKTANFSAAIAKASDEGYKLVIVLSGMHNNLRLQTEKRLRRELTDPHNSISSYNLTGMDENGDFKSTTISPNSILSAKEKLSLIVMKKNSSPLNKFLDWIKKADENIVKNCPVLIIDDEADQASINNSKNSVTKINKQIREIISYFEGLTICSYVGYTATPFANILINAKEDSDLFPKDFIVSLSAPSQYMGAEKLFGRDSIDQDGGKSGYNLIRTIKPEDKIERDDSTIPDAPPPSLVRAIDSFFLAAGERVHRGHIEKHITMLIHTSHLRDQHEKVCQIVRNYVNQSKAKLVNNDEDYLNELKLLWQNDFMEVSKLDFDDIKIGSFDETIEGVKFFVDSLQPIIKENSESEYRLNFNHGKIWGIIIGGNTLSRGLTVEGLTVSYFHRETSGYDTLLQMGRWFGYRPKYVDLVRIYVTQEMESNFFHLATVEQELREDVLRMQDNGERPIDFALKIRDHDQLTITNKRVLKQNARLASNSFSGSKLQASYVFLDNQEVNQNNDTVVRNFIEKFENADLRKRVENQTYSRCLLYRGVTSDDICDFLQSYNFSNKDKKFSEGLVQNYIRNLADKGELSDWSFAVMSKNKMEENKIYDFGIDDCKVVSLDRKHAKRASIDPVNYGTVLSSVSVPKDELIDMYDVDGINYQEILKRGRVSGSVSAYRNKRPVDRGLLMVFPIYTHSDKNKKQLSDLLEDRLMMPVVSKFPHIYAIAIVFPATKLDRFEFNYVSNITVGSNGSAA